jgi:hypothetical protein
VGSWGSLRALCSASAPRLLPLLPPGPWPLALTAHAHEAPLGGGRRGGGGGVIAKAPMHLFLAIYVWPLPSP